MLFNTTNKCVEVVEGNGFELECQSLTIVRDGSGDEIMIEQFEADGETSFDGTFIRGIKVAEDIASIMEKALKEDGRTEAWEVLTEELAGYIRRIRDL